MLSMRRHVIDCYHLYINQPIGSILSNTTQQIYHWSGLVNKCDISVKTCKLFQQSQRCKNIYGHLTPNQLKWIYAPQYSLH